MCSVENQPIFRDLSAEDPDPEVTEIESLCMNCQANGVTRLLLTRIPHYKNVILMSFSCEECGFANNEIQPGGAFAEKGIKWTLNVNTKADLNRQVVKSDYTCVKIPEVDLEIPAQSQKGEVTTVEGIIARAINGLAQDQTTRRAEHPEAAEQIDQFISKLEDLKLFKCGQFTLQLEDISGNCFIENPAMPKRDPNCTRIDFVRSKDQDHILGIYTQAETNTEESSLLHPISESSHPYESFANDEILNFNTNCPECNAVAETHMKLTKIPHFKEVVIMATVCDACGHRTNEVKSGGGIEDKGVRFEVRIAGKEDFSRDILKSETCSLTIPSLDVECGGNALGGRFSTAEGIISAIKEQLSDMTVNDSIVNKDQLEEFVKKLDDVLQCKTAVTLILDDPAGNSYVQSLSDDPTVPDEGLKITRYERTFEQNEELGLNDMKTENYEQES